MLSKEISMKKLLLLFFTSFILSPLSAQTLTKGMTEQEKLFLPQYRIPLHDFSERNYSPYFLPPVAPVRVAAEWEEAQGYLITWTSYTGMLREIVRYGKQECRMYIVTNNAGNVITDLQNNGIDTTNITFLNTPYNSVWARDYGQNSVYLNQVDSLALVDWIYNRPRPKDDTIPESLARNLQIPIYHTTQAPYDLVNTGGNWMSDGMGTAFASKLILDDNKPSGGFGINHTEAEIDTIAKKFMGIERYIKMQTLPYDGIHHIDMHMKLLDEETLLVGQYPAGIADGPQIEANIQYILSNYKTAFGTDYRIIRIPMPADNGQYPNGSGDYLTYTNASFINKTIIVPTYNISTDATALQIWREACPGYKVIGINSTSSISASGALHCITHEVGVSDPLLINHQRLTDTYNTTVPYAVTAKIQHRSGIQSATLYYTIDTLQPYQSSTLTSTDGINWQGAIPAQPAGTEVFYYLSGTSVSGKQQVRPITAPAGFYSFRVLENTGIQDFSSSEFFLLEDIFPNPSKGITCIPLFTSASEKTTIDCLNALGETVETVFGGFSKPGENKYFVDTNSFSSGVYFIRCRMGGVFKIKRFVVR